MNYILLLHTVKHLKYRQIIYQIYRKVYKQPYKDLSAPVHDIPSLRTDPLKKNKCIEGDIFTFLNLSSPFSGWNANKFGALWTNNQCYFDWLFQDGIAEQESLTWIDRFIEDYKTIVQGRRAYSTSLRIINWVKFFCKCPHSSNKKRENSLYSQLKWLEKNVEWQTMGNHVLENAFGLYIGALYFQDDKLQKKSRTILVGQLKEQILPDGAHYEQSPMYHCILLDRLLDCINICNHTDGDLIYYAQLMLGHLESIIWRDGSIPLLNDSACGIAPSAKQLFNYSHRLGLKWESIPLRECGYRKMNTERMEVIVDIGDVTASYQPGHTHADSLNYELRIEGKPFVVDTGISTYNKDERRQKERSTLAHNCVSPDMKNSSEVWSGFRVGRRAAVSDVRCMIEDGKGFVEASHNGFVKKCWRRFTLNENALVIEDSYNGDAVSYIHLAEGADEKRIKVEGANKIVLKPWLYSTEYNQFHDGKVLEIHFNGDLKYIIQ